MPERRLLAAAVTDIQGSAALWDRLGERFAPALALHNRIVRDAIASEGGTVRRTEGDSFVAAFPDAAAAVRFALRAQRDLHAAAWPAGVGELLVRIGVHADLEEGAVSSRAGAVANAGHGGQVLLSGAAGDAAGEALEGAVVTDLGEHRLDAFPGPVRLVQALPAALDSRRFPPPRTATALPTNIPPENDAFVGREAEMAELGSVMPKPEGRLVTLTGPGGIGKTRLALHAAAALLPRFPGGCWLADVSEARSADDVSRAVAGALGVPLPAGEDAARAIAAVLEYRKPLLLVLDGFETAVAHANATVGTWIQRNRHVRFLVASRSLLRLSGEREMPLGPLPSPPRRGDTRRLGQDLLSFDSVRLFLERAAAASPGFGLDALTTPAVASICSGLEGIPLALEIAAARLRELPADRIAKELEERFSLLDDPAGRPLRAALDWTLETMPRWEVSAFAQASVFRDGFLLEAAEDVLDLTEFTGAPLAIDAVQALRDRSLVRTWDTPHGTRFGMFSAIREAGERKLGEGDPAEARSLRRRHAAHYSALGRRLFADYDTARAGDAVGRVEEEEENLLATVHWALGEGDPALAAGALLPLGPHFGSRGPLALFLVPAERLDSDPAIPDIERARLSSTLARSLWTVGRGAEARAASARGVAAAERAGDSSVLARALSRQGELASYACDPAWAAILERAVSTARASGDPGALAGALLARGIGLHWDDRNLEALSDWREAETIARALGDRPGVGRHLANITTILRNLKRFDESLALHAEAEAIFREFNNRNDLATLLGNRAVVYFELGREEEAAGCTEEAVEIYRELGNRAMLQTALGNRGVMLALRGQPAKGLPLMEEALAIHRSLGTPPDSTLLNLAYALRRLGRLEDALAAVREAEEIRRARTGDGELLDALVERGEILHELGRFEEASRMFDEAAALFARSERRGTALELSLLAHRGALAARAGRDGEARALKERGLALADGYQPTKFELPERIARYGEILRGI